MRPARTSWARPRSSIAAAARRGSACRSRAARDRPAHVRSGRVPALRAGRAGRQAGIARDVSRSRSQACSSRKSTVRYVLKLTLAYDGTELVGWQRQANGDSVQGLLEDALARIDGAPSRCTAPAAPTRACTRSGRSPASTCTRAHDPATLVRALNAQLPDDVRVLAVEEAAPDFHARFSARAQDLPLPASATAPIASPFERALCLARAASRSTSARCARRPARSSGTHDFARLPGRRQRRERARCGPDLVDAASASRATPPAPTSPARCGARCVYEVTGDGFLRHMVRAIVGTLVEVGRGRRPAVDAWPPILRAAGARRAGATAPAARALFSCRVDY